MFKDAVLFGSLINITQHFVVNISGEHLNLFLWTFIISNKEITMFYYYYLHQRLQVGTITQTILSYRKNWRKNFIFFCFQFLCYLSKIEKRCKMCDGTSCVSMFNWMEWQIQIVIINLLTFERHTKTHSLDCDFCLYFKERRGNYFWNTNSANKQVVVLRFSFVRCQNKYTYLNEYFFKWIH